MDNIWTYYNLELKFIGRLCASVPSNPELISRWLENREPRVKPPGGRSIDEMNEEVFASLPQVAEEREDKEQQSLLIFQREKGTLVVRAATVRAHIKDCARVISAQAIGRIKGERSFATKVVNGVYHDELTYWLPLLRNQEPILEADGIHEKAVRFRTPDGRQLSALKAFEYVNEPTIKIRLKVLGSSPNETDLTTIFLYGGTHGYGGERGDGEGRYGFTLTKETTNGRQN